MLKDLSLAKGSISNWQERGTIPNGETLSKIANYFNVSVDYLLGNEQKEKPDTISDEPTELEKLILDKIDQLDEDGKKLALAQLDVLLTVHQENKDK